MPLPFEWENYVFTCGLLPNFSKDPISTFKPSGSNLVPQAPYGSNYLQSFWGK
jgi:hypothetical protein